MPFTSAAYNKPWTRSSLGELHIVKANLPPSPHLGSLFERWHRVGLEDSQAVLVEHTHTTTAVWIGVNINKLVLQNIFRITPRFLFNGCAAATVLLNLWGEGARRSLPGLKLLVSACRYVAGHFVICLIGNFYLLLFEAVLDGSALYDGKHVQTCKSRTKMFKCLNSTKNGHERDPITNWSDNSRCNPLILHYKWQRENYVRQWGLIQQYIRDYKRCIFGLTT